jgi:predicted dehydrogenase/threonine dehydrogenase-like Zn-dependent dehydrogenase
VKQVLQSLGSGLTEVAAVPSPSAGRGEVLIRTARSFISAGTERMLVEFGKANLIQKAMQQPDRVQMALDKARTDGILPTFHAVRQKLDQPLPLGYCNAGRVIGLGAGVTGFAIGDRVASNGKHAEIVAVPVNLCAKIPDAVSDDAAALTPLAAVALHGLRLVQPTLGECVVVTGLGLVGLITVQLLRANGCRVLGIDRNVARLALARHYGADVVDLSAGEDPVGSAMRFSRNNGVDAVIIAASTKSAEPVQQAAAMSRKRGRIVLVGVTGLDLSRDEFFKKELSFQVSCSYGPGRYDPSYEEQGNDYPLGYVRWTEQRNFEAVLETMAEGRLDVSQLISHRYPIDQAAEAFGALSDDKVLGAVFEYPEAGTAPATRLSLASSFPTLASSVTRINVIGAGNYATAMLLPALKHTAASLQTVVSRTGVSAALAARKFGFRAAATDPAEAIADDNADAIVIATQHDSHARFVIDALDAGKHVFVEKPLCLTLDELAAVESAYRRAQERSGLVLMVGFNRRFAPHVLTIKKLLQGTAGPKSLVMTVNAGSIPASHWAQDPARGGGRLTGEGCHFIDLLRFLTGSPISAHHTTYMHAGTLDTATTQLVFEDGSIGTVHYFANGSKRFPKERLEVFADGRILQLDNFRKLKGFGWAGFSKQSLWSQDKGHRACMSAFVDAVRDGTGSPIPFDQIAEVTRITIVAAGSSKSR